MNCNCAKYQPIELNRKSINKRIRGAKQILSELILVAENDEHQLKLLQCPVCEQHWQTGREWNFGHKEYVFQVPAITIEEWLSEPYMQPAGMMIYSALMETYYAQNTFESTSKPCRVEDCENKAVRLSIFCEVHHIEQLQKARLLPKRPQGRLFLPYS